MASPDATPSLRPRCDVCGQPACVWTVARGLDTARCRRCDALERELQRHADTLFRCPVCFAPFDALHVGLACPLCAARLPCPGTAALCNRRLPGDPTS